MMQQVLKRLKENQNEDHGIGMYITFCIILIWEVGHLKFRVNVLLGIHCANKCSFFTTIPILKISSSFGF